MRRLIPLALCLLLSSCSSLVEKPRVRVDDVRLAQSTLREQRFDVTLSVHNPNPIALSAKGVNFRLQVAGKPLASGSSAQAFEVPARGDGSVTVSVSTSLASWLRESLRALGESDGKLPWTLDGEVVGVPVLGDLPFRREGQWSLADKLKPQ